VDDFKGKGMEVTISESGETIIQNLAEAEFVVATYMYLRLYSGIG
jgi:hypothetical protein